MVSYEKMSKKAKKAEDAKRRNDWGVINPVTKVVKSKKVYSRKQKHKNSGSEGF